MWTYHTCERTIHVDVPYMWTYHTCGRTIHVNVKVWGCMYDDET